MNNNIIKQFTKLINLIKITMNNLDISDKENNINKYRLKSLKNILNIIKKYPKEINNNNIEEFSKLPGIGKGTINRIKEILKTGKLSELDEYSQSNDDIKYNKIIEELESVVGIGNKLAIDLYNKGILSIKDLKKKINNKEIIVNDKIKLGLKYYGKFHGNIPRNEIINIKSVIKSIINDMNKQYYLNNTNKYIFKICGSYRRKKPTSGDIDILITKYESNTNINHLKIFIDKLKQPITNNNNKSLIIDDITDKNYTTKYMGFCKYKNNLIRRIDIRFVPYKYYHSALLYFTGSAEFNKKLRLHAKKLGYKLSEYGLYTIKDNKKIKINSEKDIFNILNIDYIKPKYR